ncbi:mercuric reductase [Enterovibrio norvegicus]|uniref:mercuric reductase n=1 Tax=Enterovibrio norvegicus TaxID=188144 RepID=UPI000C82DD93|nr:mercuric reductase [Enterovibrio norvegicus]PMN72134.1 mercuric reductase [Enterovibrio norvegicus]
MEQFDKIVIGSGQAAPALAAQLAKRGFRVALIEGDQLGGTCVNNGCTPTKTLRKSAKVAHMVKHAEEFGVSAGDVQIDFLAAMERMRERVNTSRAGLTQWLNSFDNIEVIFGWGQIAGKDGDKFLVDVDGRRLAAPDVFLNTGTRSFTPPVTGLDSVRHLDNRGLLALNERPSHLVIVGGSYIGLEMAQIFRRLGSEVSILHRADALAEREDPDVSDIIADMMKDEGVNLYLEAAMTSLAPTDNGGVTVTLGNGEVLEASHILFATGRVPNTENLALESVGVERDDRGYIKTNPQLQTNVPGIWALGDVNRRGAFTHTSYHDHEIVLASLDGMQDLYQWKGADQRPTTYAMFTDPPLGRVGLSMTDAKKRVAEGQNILISDMKMANVSRAKEESETRGLIRLIVDGDTEQFLGATVFGLNGDEIISVITNYMATGASYRIMQQALPVHPTVSELLPTILAGLKPLTAE